MKFMCSSVPTSCHMASASPCTVCAQRSTGHACTTGHKSSPFARCDQAARLDFCALSRLLGSLTCHAHTAHPFQSIPRAPPAHRTPRAVAAVVAAAPHAPTPAPAAPREASSPWAALPQAPNTGVNVTARAVQAAASAAATPARPKASSLSKTAHRFAGHGSCAFSCSRWPAVPWAERTV
jgi:hypothetical protein